MNTNKSSKLTRAEQVFAIAMRDAGGEHAGTALLALAGHADPIRVIRRLRREKRAAERIHEATA